MAKTDRVDPDEATRVAALLRQCRQRGLDPVQVLDGHGFLDHGRKRLEARRVYTRQLVDAIEALTPTQLGEGVVPATAADMKLAIVNFLRKLT